MSELLGICWDSRRKRRREETEHILASEVIGVQQRGSRDWQREEEEESSMLGHGLRLLKTLVYSRRSSRGSERKKEKGSTIH